MLLDAHCFPFQKWRAATKPQIQIEVKKVGGADEEDGFDVKLGHTTELNAELDESNAQREVLLSKEAEAEANHTSPV